MRDPLHSALLLAAGVIAVFFLYAVALTIEDRIAKRAARRGLDAAYARATTNEGIRAALAPVPAVLLLEKDGVVLRQVMDLINRLDKVDGCPPSSSQEPPGESASPSASG